MLQKDRDSFKLIYPEGWEWDSQKDLDEPPTVNFEQWSSSVSKTPAACRIENKPSASSVLSIADTPRFAAPMSESAVQQARKAAVPKSTQTDTLWCFSLWTEWAKQRNTRTVDVEEQVPLDITPLSPMVLQHWMSRFVLELRKKDGNESTRPTRSTILSVV